MNNREIKKKLLFFIGKIDQETGLPIVEYELVKCKFGKKVYDEDCYDCEEFKKGRCGR